MKGNYCRTSLLAVDGAALTKARIAAGLSVGDVADRIPRCDKGKVSRWETGVLMPSPERLWRLVEMLGTRDFIRLNGKAVLTWEEIEAVKKLREG